MILQVNLCSQQGLPCIKPAMLRHLRAVTDKGLPGMDCHPSAINESLAQS